MPLTPNRLMELRLAQFRAIWLKWQWRRDMLDDWWIARAERNHWRRRRLWARPVKCWLGQDRYHRAGP